MSSGYACMFPSCIIVYVQYLPCRTRQSLSYVETDRIRSSLKLYLELNELANAERGPLRQLVRISGATNYSLTISEEPSYEDDPLVAGPEYRRENFKISYATHLGLLSSGVLLIGLNSGTRLTYQVHTSRPTRAFKLQGRLRRATDTYHSGGQVVEKASYGHVTREIVDRVVANMQSAHQKKVYELSGVHMDSQAAYDLASQGLIRPANSKLPVVYGIKCVEFKPPFFTIEIQSVNEYDKYLYTLIHDLGIQLKTVAHCTGLQCIRHGMFDLNAALLRKHWQLKYILDNMVVCNRILTDNGRLLYPDSAWLM